MTKPEWDKLFAEITASLTNLRGALTPADNGSADQARLFERLSAVRGEIESLAKECLKDSPGPSKPQPSEFPDEELRRKWKEESRLTPELREWALQLFSEEEILAGLREIEETGGVEFSDMIRELDEIVKRP